MNSEFIKFGKQIGMEKRSVLILVILGVLLIDRFSKYIVIKYFPELIVFNQNGLFGILPWWISLLAFLMISFYIYKEKYYNLVLIVILTAGLSNLIDRLYYEGVVDFVSIGNFPVFNFADSVISVGVVWLMIKELKTK